MSGLPALVVFDLDECTWSPETYELSDLPKKCVQGDLGDAGVGVVGVYAGSDMMKLYPGALHAFQHHLNGKYPGTRFAVASSAVTRGG